MTAKEYLAAHEGDIVNTRRHLHMHPEISFQEHETAAYIENRLAAIGLTTRRVGETGVYAAIRGDLPGDKVIALRADIDALAIEETGDVPYKSTRDGTMHACGHDAHTACLLAAAEALCATRASWGGEIRLIFQHAEEFGGGAIPFIKAGCLDGAERVFGLHTASDLTSGIIGVKAGSNNASVDHFTITVEGLPAHVSTPHMGVDALYIASQIVVSLQGIATRRVSPIDPIIIGVGVLQAGTAYNIVAGSARMEGTLRAMTPETRAFVREQIGAVAAETAKLYGGTASIVWKDFTSPLVNDKTVCREVAEVIETHWGVQAVKTDRPLSLGGDDMAELLLKVPGCYAYLGTHDPAKSTTGLAHHHSSFDIDESALLIGATLYAEYALHFLNKTY